jgi:DNA-binding transcriptional MerR regulator
MGGASRFKSRDNTAAIATQFGVSVKALRLYEQRGMLRAPRTKAGHRVYGRAEIARLHIILSLKQLGLPLAHIAQLLKRGTADLKSVLAMQERALLESRSKADHALALIRLARQRAEKDAAMSADELAELVRHFDRSIVRWTPELDDLARRVYTPAQIAAYNTQHVDCDNAAAWQRAWASFYADLEPIMQRGDPLSDDALAMARRMTALVRAQTGGDRDLWTRASTFWREAVNDPKTARGLPMTKAHYEFIGQGLKELQRRGELVL